MGNNKMVNLRNALKLTQTEFGQSVGLTRAAIASYEYGAANPTAVAKRCIELQYNVDPRYWDEDGDEHMFVKPKVMPGAIYAADAPTDSIISEIVRMWERMSPAERAVVENLIEKFLLLRKEGKEAQEDSHKKNA